MTIACINGISISYEVHGDCGPWVALSPGGRRGLGEIRSLSGRFAVEGYRVLIHDRRNCGASEISIAGEGAEHEIWASDLHALLLQLDALPTYIGGSSSSCRMAIAFALRYPQAVRGLLLWRMTGGAFAVNRLTEKYFGEYIRAARRGGMSAVCETEHFRELIAARAANRQMLMSMDPRRFIEVMIAWDDQFRSGVDQPFIGASENQLKSIALPTCVVPGNDLTHPKAVGELLARLMPKAELHPLMGENLDVDVDAPENWDAREDALAAILIGCLRRWSDLK